MRLDRDYALMAAMTYGATLTRGIDGVYVLTGAHGPASRHSTRASAIRKLTRFGRQLRPDYVYLYTSTGGRLRWVLSHGISNCDGTGVRTAVYYSDGGSTRMEALDNLIGKLRAAAA